MKKAFWIVPIAILLLISALLMPIGAAFLPADSAMVTVRSEIAAHLGVDTPGAAVVLVRRGKEPFKEGFGYAAIDTKEHLITLDAVFEIGEISSVFVALAVYRLMEEGKLSLQADISTYLPEQMLEKLDLQYPTTVRQLLLGTAGFEGRSLDLIFDKDAYRFDSLEKALLAEIPRQVYCPDTCYSASPFGIALAAYVVECVSKENYANYVNTHILTPLGMTKTFLNPTEDTVIEQLAAGHRKTDDGTFAVGKRQGRSYAGLYPVSGACSTANDMAVLMDFLLFGNASVLSDSNRAELFSTTFQNGVFTVSAPALTVRGKAMGVDSKTLCFGASLWMDPESGTGALVLTNAADSVLLKLPAQLCGATLGVAVDMNGGEYLDVKKLKGEYLSLSEEGHSFVGRVHRKNNTKTVKTTPDGNIIFDGVTLYQAAPGIFASAQDGTGQLQFLLDEKGEVSLVLSAAGESYRPAKFFEKSAVATILFYLLLGLTLWFLVVGVVAWIRYLARRHEEADAPGFVYTLPFVLGALTSLVVLLQIWVGTEYSGTVFSSFFGAFSVITLVLSTAAMISTVVALAFSVLRKGMTTRVMRTVTMLVIYVLLIGYWQLSLL
ncbi:MAG: beta-lactamase family protein [Ruminococcaceae bacterium]|nr:beta-lactamase family protein [Oscillospiraceae bacterium]